MPARLRLGLFARIALALAATGFLPLWLVSSQLLVVNRQALEEQSKTNVSLAARTAAERMESLLEARRQLAQATARDSRLGDAANRSAWDVLLEHVRAGEPLGLRAAAIVDEAGQNLVRAQLPEDAARLERAFAAPGGDAVVWLPQADGHPLLRLGVPLGERSLRLVFDGAPLLGVVGNPREVADGTQTIVVGSDRRVLFGPPSALEGMPGELLDNALSGKIGAGSRRDFAGPHGERLAAGYGYVDAAGWAVLSRQPLASAEAVAAQMRRRSWLAVGGATGLILMLCGAAWATLVRPLRSLVRAQRRLAGVHGAAAGDEVQALTASFRALERSVRDREDLGRVFLGRYQVVEIIGRGAMGTVFRGWDPKLQRPVALKTVRLDQNLEPDRRRRLVSSLMSEAVTGARFNHPNILQVYDVEDLPQATFIATEFVDGMSLDFLLWLKDRLPADLVVPLGAAIARGLAVAHAHGVVHRDVKPSNILLGRDGAIKVADFGIAGLVAATAARGDEIFGTPGYLPPEALLGEGYGPSGDLFALGVILYQGLAGRLPFGGKTPSELARRTVMGTLLPLAKVAPETPEPLCAIVQSLLEKNPRRRAGPADRLAEELEDMARRSQWRWILPDVGGARDEIYTAPTDAQFLRTELLETPVPRPPANPTRD